MLKNRFTFINLTPADTTYYKGIAILMIIMHNFFHWLPPKIGENEQNFSLLRLERYFQVIYNQPELFFQATFSFLGHYGVQIFLFLSAYGLTKKYINKKIVYKHFLVRRILKIYPAFLFSIIIWAIYVGYNNGGPIEIILNNWKQLAVKLVFIANFIPGQLYKINGPWWFVSLIVQFYIIFPFILYLYKKYSHISLMVISFVALVLTAYLQSMVDFPLPGTILTHIPEVCIGVFLAQQQRFTMNYFTILSILIVFILSNIYAIFWFLSYSSSLILLLIAFQKISIKSSKLTQKFILFIGSISMYIFYINGFMRAPWIGIAKDYNLWYFNIFICIVFMIIVIVMAYLMMFISSKINKKMEKVLK